MSMPPSRLKALKDDGWRIHHLRKLLKIRIKERIETKTQNSHNFSKEIVFHSTCDFRKESAPIYGHGIWLGKESQKTKRVKYI